MQNRIFFFAILFLMLTGILSTSSLFAVEQIPVIHYLNEKKFIIFANDFIKHENESGNFNEALKELYVRGRFLELSSESHSVDSLKPFLERLRNLMASRTARIAISGTWKTNNIIGTSTLIIGSKTYVERNEGLYPWSTSGDIVCYNNTGHYFIVRVKTHSESWGQDQIGKYGRCAWAPELNPNGEIDLNKIRYSGALNFFDKFEDAVNDTDFTNGAADPINGKFDIYFFINQKQ